MFSCSPHTISINYLIPFSIKEVCASSCIQAQSFPCFAFPALLIYTMDFIQVYFLYIFSFDSQCTKGIAKLLSCRTCSQSSELLLLGMSSTILAQINISIFFYRFGGFCFCQHVERYEKNVILSFVLDLKINELRNFMVRNSNIISNGL